MLSGWHSCVLLTYGVVLFLGVSRKLMLMVTVPLLAQTCCRCSCCLLLDQLGAASLLLSRTHLQLLLQLMLLSARCCQEHLLHLMFQTWFKTHTLLTVHPACLQLLLQLACCYCSLVVACLSIAPVICVGITAKAAHRAPSMPAAPPAASVLLVGACLSTAPVVCDLSKQTLLTVHPACLQLLLQLASCRKECSIRQPLRNMAQRSSTHRHPAGKVMRHNAGVRTIRVHHPADASRISEQNMATAVHCCAHLFPVTC
jgi:hypothetical protein